VTNNVCPPRAQADLERVIVEHMNFGKKRAGLNRTIFFALALAGEAGELCNIIKKKLRGDRKYKGKAGAALFAKQVDGETVDLGNYVYMMAAHREIPLTKRMLEKLLEVEARDDDWNRLPVKLSKRPQRLPINCRCTVGPVSASNLRKAGRGHHQCTQPAQGRIQ
jgi:hypothetical protein